MPIKVTRWRPILPHVRFCSRVMIVKSWLRQRDSASKKLLGAGRMSAEKKVELISSVKDEYGLAPVLRVLDLHEKKAFQSGVCVPHGLYQKYVMGWKGAEIGR